MPTADVTIIGGGVIGCSIAYHLTTRGVTDVLLLEKARLASGATGICPGGIRQQFEGEADCLLAQRSVRFFERINDLLQPEAPFLFERSGYMFLADSDQLLDRFRQNVSLQNRLGIPSRIISPGEIRDLLPALNTDGCRGAAFCADDGFIEDCDGVTNAFARIARQRGARIVYEEVRHIRRANGGWRVETTTDTFESGHVAIAAGADTLELAAALGVELPISRERRRLAYTVPGTPGTMPPLVVALERGVACKQLTNGVFYLGWLGDTATVDDLTFIERSMEAASTLVAELAELPVRRVVAGIYDTTPDHRPILGALPGAPHVYVAAGFSGHGFMMAPAVGEGIAAIILGGANDPLISSFSVDRFAAAPPREGLQI
jgi:sarcosine oxidase subunit beta